MSRVEPSPVPSPELLQTPLAHLLRPLVRLLIQAGITFPAAADLLRQLYVQVADQEFRLEDKDQTDSRVSLLTGVHRKEVRKLRAAGTPVNTAPASLSRSSQILSRWVGAAEYLGPDGRPRPLPRTAERPDMPSFEGLVASVTRDVRARAVLDDWLAQGLVAVDGDGCVVLSSSAYLPQQGSPDLLYYFGRNLHDHIAAAANNVAGRQPRCFDRAVHYDGLTEDQARRLEALSKEIAMAALTTANQSALAESTDGQAGRWRWIFGAYVYREESGTAPEDQAG